VPLSDWFGKVTNTFRLSASLYFGVNYLFRSYRIYSAKNVRRYIVSLFVCVGTLVAGRPQPPQQETSKPTWQSSSGSWIRRLTSQGPRGNSDLCGCTSASSGCYQGEHTIQMKRRHWRDFT
jgi:hypothetical protein